jgi:hypothetical protein
MNYFDHLFKSLASQPTADKVEMVQLFSFLQLLVELGYSHFKSIVLPQVTRRIAFYLNADTNSVRLLVSLFSLMEEKKILEGVSIDGLGLGSVVDKLGVYSNAEEQVKSIYMARNCC